MNARGIEKQWRAGQLSALGEELLRRRVEFSHPIGILLADPMAGAALALLRLADLAPRQRSPEDSIGPFLPMPAPPELINDLVEHLGARQRADGRWGSTMLTALAVKALAAVGGAGGAVGRGMRFLVENQGDDGHWGLERRPPGAAVPLATAYVLYLLGDDPLFRRAARVDEARSALRRGDAPDAHRTETARLWSLCGAGRPAD